MSLRGWYIIFTEKPAAYFGGARLRKSRIDGQPLGIKAPGSSGLVTFTSWFPITLVVTGRCAILLPDQAVPPKPRKQATLSCLVVFRFCVRLKF